MVYEDTKYVNLKVVLTKLNERLLTKKGILN